MPIIGARVMVTSTATQIMVPTNGGANDPISGSLLNLGPNDCDLGGAGVATGSGYLLRVGGTMDVDLMHGDTLFGVTASGTTIISILKTRQ